jgi:hypothetical protein
MESEMMDCRQNVPDFKGINQEETFVGEESETEEERLEREMEEAEERRVNEANRQWVKEHKQRLHEICEKSWEGCITAYQPYAYHLDDISRPPEKLLESQGIIDPDDNIWVKRSKLDSLAGYIDRWSIFSLDFGNGPEGLFILLRKGRKKSDYEVAHYNDWMSDGNEDEDEAEYSNWHVGLPLSVDKAQMLLNAGVKPVKVG